MCVGGGPQCSIQLINTSLHLSDANCHVQSLPSIAPQSSTPPTTNTAQVALEEWTPHRKPFSALFNIHPHPSCGRCPFDAWFRRQLPRLLVALHPCSLQGLCEAWRRRGYRGWGRGCMEGVDTPQRCARKESSHTMDEDCSR